MHYSFSILKSYGATATAASLTSIDSTIAYSAGTGVAIVDTHHRDNFSFRVCAPKQLKSRINTAQLGSMSAESKASLRINQTSCLALSDRFVALGETGHCPRVVILDRSSGAILATIQEHQFGVHLLRFSPSGDLLATLGTPNDGYIYVWNTSGKVSVRVSNRCISEISALCWLSETTLVTAGVRHLRVWTVGEGSVLTGRNIVLGELANSRFTSVMRKSETEFYAGNEIGQIFICTEGRLDLYAQTGERVQSLSPHQDHILAAGPTMIKSFADGKLEKEVAQINEGVVTAGDSVVYLESGSINEMGSESISGTTFTGVVACPDGFAAWNSEMLAYFDKEGSELRRQPLDNPLAVAIGDQPALVQAFGNGTVTIGEQEFVAHVAEGAGISIHAKSGWAVSAGRDHLQIYQFGTEPSVTETGNTGALPDSNLATQWQTLSMHGRVSKAKVIDSRTIVAIITSKVINIITADSKQTFSVAKSIPTTSPVQDFVVYRSQLHVSTLDKKMTVYDLEGNIIESFPTLDMLGEPVTLMNFEIFEQNQRPLIAASVNDKSVAIYDRGELLACQWAHSEVPKVLVVGELIISAASDGMFVYKLVQEASPPARPASPVRIVREARSPSPIRRPKTIIRSPEKPAERPERSPADRFSERLLPRSTTKSPLRTRSPMKTEVLKLAPPKFGLEPNGSASGPVSESVSLESQLKQYIASGKPDPLLFGLLAKAMELDPQAMGHYAKKLSEHFNP